MKNVPIHRHFEGWRFSVINEMKVGLKFVIDLNRDWIASGGGIEKTQPDVGSLVRNKLFSGIENRSSCQTSLPNSNSGINYDSDKSEFFHKILLALVRCIFSAFGIVLICKIWRPSNFDLSANMYITGGKILLSAVLI